MPRSLFDHQNFLPTLTSEGYYQSFFNYLQTINLTKASALTIYEDWLIFDKNHQPVLFVYRTNKSDQMESVVKAFTIVMEGLLYLNTCVDLLHQCSSLDMLFSDDWPFRDLEIGNDKLFVSEELYENNEGRQSFKRKLSLDENEDCLPQTRVKRIQSEVVKSHIDNCNTTEEIKSLIIEMISQDVICDHLTIYGLIEVIWEEKLPFTVIPLLCFNKREILQKIISLSIMREILNPVINDRNDIKVLSILKQMVTTDFTLEQNAVSIEAYFDEYGRILTPEKPHKVHSTMFILHDDILCSKGSESKTIPPMYINSKQRPLKSKQNKILILRSLLLNLMSYFPKQPPHLPGIQRTLPGIMLSSLIETGFIIKVLTAAITYKSEKTSATDILLYYFLCLQSIAGNSKCLMSINVADAAVILMGQKDDKQKEEDFRRIISCGQKDLILQFLKENMVPLSSFLLISEETGTYIPPLVYKDDNRKLHFGISYNSENSSTNVFCRDADLGTEITHECDFGLMEDVVKEINLYQDKKLLGALVVEATNPFVTLTHFIKRLCNDNCMSAIFDEYQSFITDEDNKELLKHLIEFEGTTLIVGGIDLTSSKDVLLLRALNTLYEMKSPLIKAKYMSNTNNSLQYIVFFEGKFVSLPSQNHALTDQINNHREIFNENCNVKISDVIKWFSLSILTPPVLKSIYLQLNPTLTTFIASLFDFFKRGFNKIVGEILEEVINSSEVSKPSVSCGDTLESVIQMVAKRNLYDVLKNYETHTKLSHIFTVCNDRSFVLFHGKSALVFFTDGYSFLHYDDVLTSKNEEMWNKLHFLDTTIQQLLWRNLVRTDFESFKGHIHSEVFNSSILYSYGCKNIKLLEFGNSVTENIFSLLIKSTQLGEKGDIFEIIDKYMSKFDYPKLSWSQQATMYISKKNRPIFLAMAGDDSNICDLLILHYLTTQDLLIGFAFAKFKSASFPHLTMLIDNSAKTKQFFALETINNVLDFFRNKYGNFIYTYHPFKDRNDCIMIDKFSYSKETSILTQIILWQQPWDSTLNVDYNLLPSLIRYAYYINPIKTLLKPFSSLNYTASKNILEITECDNFKYQIVHLNNSCSTLIFENTKDLLTVLQEKKY